MNQPSTPINVEFFQLTKAAFVAGWERLQAIFSQKKYIGTYSDWPKMSLLENGLPRFSETFFLDPAPTDYKRAFGKNEEWQIRTESIPEFVALVRFARTDPRLINYFSWNAQRTPDEFFDFIVTYFVEKIIDRYMHLFPDSSPGEDKFTQIYCPLETYIYEETLLVDIIVPILFLKFDFDKHILGPNALVERMSEDFQLARYSKKAFTPSINSMVLGAATHSLVLKGWSITNTNDFKLSTAFSDIRFYQNPLEVVDSFFAALRVSASLATGYAQILVRPSNWASTYVAHLPALEGTSLRRYPAWFENFYWTQQIPTVSAETLTSCSKMFHQLSEIENNRVRIAVRRLNGCYLREGEEDSILDATIAMEALLSDDDRQEMTHKLAMRIAALSTLAENRTQTPTQIFKAVKQIYRFRSKIVHGSTKTDKGREIHVTPTQKVPTITLALDYLRMLISVVVNHQEFLKPSNIDEFLLLKQKLNNAKNSQESFSANHVRTSV